MKTIAYDVADFYQTAYYPAYRELLKDYRKLTRAQDESDKDSYFSISAAVRLQNSSALLIS